MAQGIVYTCVARGASVLAEAATVEGNFQTIARKILIKISHVEGRMSYQYDFNVGQMTYLCVAEQNFDRRTVFAYLADVQKRYESENGSGSYQTGNFGSQLILLMKQYSSQSTDRIARAQSDVNELKGVVEENIGKILERGERIDLLVGKTEELQQSSIAFRKKSTSLKKAMWWKNVYLWLAIIVVILVVIFFVVVLVCGGFSFSKCKSKKMNLASFIKQEE
ncbi:MAG: putative Vesicle-associated membrane protein [Streblomastix strix]|uniref:Putative Vesicle-associated membrane protein n=1 Tax=Streblomastix strix TaxID=222440 RepID=A0A5J4W680_9EUKA|nr:MAG: putative Vesicle-associated membrane protein [Streblomastix strix]